MMTTTPDLVQHMRSSFTTTAAQSAQAGVASTASSSTLADNCGIGAAHVEHAHRPLPPGTSEVPGVSPPGRAASPASLSLEEPHQPTCIDLAAYTTEVDRKLHADFQQLPGHRKIGLLKERFTWQVGTV